MLQWFAIVLFLKVLAIFPGLLSFKIIFASSNSVLEILHFLDCDDD